MKTTEANVGQMETQLKQWGAKLDDLAAKATNAGAKAKTNERRLVAELKAKQELAQAKLEELKAAGADKWETFRAGVESVYNELEGAFKKLGN